MKKLSAEKRLKNILMRTDLLGWHQKILLPVILLSAFFLSPVSVHSAGTLADSFIANGGDSGAPQSADSGGDTFVTGNFIGNYAVSNSASVKVSTGYAIASLSQPSDQTALNGGTTLFYGYSFRNAGNATDYFTVSTQVVSAYNCNCGPYLNAYLVQTDSFSSLSQPIMLTPETTCVFLLAVPVPADAPDLSSTKISITVKNRNGSGTNDNWPVFGANDDTLTSTVTATLSFQSQPPPVVYSTMTLSWLTSPPIVRSSDSLTMQWQVTGGNAPYSARVVHVGRTIGTIVQTPAVSTNGIFSTNFTLDLGENDLTVTVKDSTPALNTVISTVSIFRGIEVTTAAGETEAKLDVTAGSAFYRMLSNPETKPLNLEVNNGMKILIPEGTFSGFAMVQIMIGAETDKIDSLRKASGGIGLIPGNELNMVNIDVVGNNGKIQPGKSVTLTIPYRDPTPNDSDDDYGYRIAYFDESTSKWEVAGGHAEINPFYDTVKVSVNHFTLFATVNARPPASDFSSLIVYPNPFKPNSGNPRKGKEYALSDQESGIIFDGLTENAKIRIYTVTGEKVRELTAPYGTSRLRWDVKNENGETITSGLYFYLVSDLSGKKVKGKLAIIR